MTRELASRSGRAVSESEPGHRETGETDRPRTVRQAQYGREAGRLLERAHLEARLDDAFGSRLTSIVAGAGYGKTTLLTQWSRDVEHAWLTVAESDRRLDAFTAGVVRALRPLVGTLRVEAGIQSAPPDDAMRADAIAARIAERLEGALDHDFVLVLDDAHELEGSSSARLVDGLVRQAPPYLHVVLTSRDEPPFRIQRLRGQGQVLELDASDLAFGADEIADLLELSLAKSARPLAERLYELTSGWPAAVRLAVGALEHVTEDNREQALERLYRPEGPLLDYLSEEVLEREPISVRRLIGSVASFERFTPELCETLGLAESRKAIDSLRRRGLFLAFEENGTGFLTLHAVMREFARERLLPSAGELRELHGRAADWFEREGRLEDALRSRLACGDPEELARFLGEHGEELLVRGSSDAVVQAGQALAPEQCEGRLAEVLGEAFSLKGEWEEALACYERAVEDEDELPPGLAWRLGRLHWDRGQPDDAKAAFERGRLDGSGSADEALLLAWTASPYWGAGDIDRARSLADRALVAAKRSGSARALAAAHNAVALNHLGHDNSLFEQHMVSAIAAAEDAGDVLQVVRFTINRCGPAEPREAIAWLGDAIARAELAGAGLYLARALNARGENLLALGRYDDAVADLRRALALWEQSGSTRRAWALMSLASVARHRGHLAYARAAYEEALELSSDAEGQINARGGLARVLAFEEPESARRLAQGAVEEARRFAPMLNTALLAAGWVALSHGDREGARARAAEALAETHRQRTRFEYAEALELAAMTAAEAAKSENLLEESFAVWHEIGNDVAVARVELALARLRGDRTGAERARRRLEAAGVRAQASAAAGLLASLPPGQPDLVRVRTLGSFALLRDGQPVPVGAWPSRKARDLLKILVARRGRGVPRAWLMETLWPNDDPTRLGNRLSVALSLLRSTLDPDRRFEPDHYVSAGSGGIALRLDVLPLDVEDFLADAGAGLELLRSGKPEEARERLRGAEAAYAGDFLEEDVYEEWTATLREEARVAYVAVAHALAGLALAGDHLAEAARYLLRVIEQDPYDERAHLALVETLARAGHHGEARRCYAAYSARMAEIGVEAAPYSSGARAP